MKRKINDNDKRKERESRHSPSSFLCKRLRARKGREGRLSMFGKNIEMHECSPPSEPTSGRGHRIQLQRTEQRMLFPREKASVIVKTVPFLLSSQIFDSLTTHVPFPFFLLPRKIKKGRREWEFQPTGDWVVFIETTARVRESNWCSFLQTF